MAKSKEETVTIIGQIYDPVNRTSLDTRSGHTAPMTSVQLVIDGCQRRYFAIVTGEHPNMSKYIEISRKEYKRLEDLIVKTLFS